MNKQNQIHRIINYCPWPGTFSLLEIFICLVGIFVTVFLFRFTSSLNTLYGNIYIRRINMVLNLGPGAILFIIAVILWWSRRLRHSQMKQYETEIQQPLHLRAALNTDQVKLSTLLTNLSDPVFVIDSHANIINANPAAAYLMGYSKPELLAGKNEIDLLEPELTKEILEEGQTILKTGKSLIHKEATCSNRTTGECQQLLITKAALHSQHGQITGLIAIVQNVTAQKQAEAALRSANQKLSEGIAELEQTMREMDSFMQMMSVLSACPNIEEGYKIIEDQLGKLNLADSGMLYMIKPSRNNVQQVATWGQSDSDSPVFPPSDCWGLRRGRLHITEFNHVSGHGSHHANPLLCPHISLTTPADHLCLPLIAQGETLGILHLRHLIDIESIESAEASKSWFTPNRVQRTNIIAESLALAIANLTLRSTLRQQSIRDPLTGLYNRRYLEETLERELLRAVRSNKNVGLMMIDVDHFKQFNDTYGHPAADAVLSAISHLLSSSIRREDLVCRYGGEEILIMLPETDLETTCQRAEVIREKVTQLNVQYQGQVLKPVSISIGAAIFPDHGQTPEALIHSADKALYRAKNNGRNQVEIAIPSLVEARHDPWQRLHSHADDRRINRRVTIPQ